MKSNIQKRKYEKCNRLKRFECDQSDISDGATCVVSASVFFSMNVGKQHWKSCDSICHPKEKTILQVVCHAMFYECFSVLVCQAFTQSAQENFPSVLYLPVILILMNCLLNDDVYMLKF